MPSSQEALMDATKKRAKKLQRHGARPLLSGTPRRTIAFLTETAFQGLPLQLLMPRRSSSAAIVNADSKVPKSAEVKIPSCRG